MAKTELTWVGILLRFLAAVILVFSTYNPEGYSYFHWVSEDFQQDMPLKIFAGVVLLIGWTIFLRATIGSLGAFGLILAFAFFGTLLWLVISWGLVPADSVRAISYIILLILCGVLATGLMWSHVRRRITGQVDTDHVDNDL
jgi:hypothetical protein